MLLSLVLHLLFIHAAILDNYEDNTTHSERMFRTLKYNHIWNKALKSLGKEDLETLSGILRKLDKSEIELKHQKAERGNDYDKELERIIQSHLANTLERFGLYDSANKKDYESLTFQDQRLNGLWTQALKEGVYEGDELASLYEEILQVQSKIDDYHKLSEQADKDEQLLNDRMGNDLKTVDGKEFKKMKKEQKENFHKLNERVKILEETVSERASNPSKTFTDSRVLELWDLAKRSGRFNLNELEVIKEELTDFQNRIHKLRHWERIQDKLHKSVHEDGYNAMQDEYIAAKEKVREHKKYVKKYHATMMDRVYQHTEL